MLLSLALSSLLSACSLFKSPIDTLDCKIHTYIEQDFGDYLSERFNSDSASPAPVRMAIIPFDVQETFAQLGPDSRNFGRELAKNFLLYFQQEGIVPIVELFNRDRWPGKRSEFFSGNYRAISLARDAGYDLVLIGFLEDLNNDTSLNLHTKIIDTANGVTLWNARTTVSSSQRLLERELRKVNLGIEKPAAFYFPERGEKVAQCTVERIAQKKK